MRILVLMRYEFFALIQEWLVRAVLSGGEGTAS